MKPKFTAWQLDYMYSVLFAKLEEHICNGFVSWEEDIAELHRCLATLTEMSALANEEKKQTQENVPT